MSNRYKVILFLFVTIFSKIECRNSAVTYTFSGGRWGDNLVAYCHAFWIAYLWNLDFLYKPFKYSDQLFMHETDILYSEALVNEYKQVLHISHALSHGLASDTLYIIPYFPESHIEHNDPRCPFLFQVDWNNQGYIHELKKRIKPQYILNMPDLTEDCITVAVHIRKGTGWDIPLFAPCFEKLTEMHPLKWPPDSYYLDQIMMVLQQFPQGKIYIHIFTDHDKPQEIIEKYQQYIHDERVQWACRAENNKHDLNVLEDFFALTLFDCLIRNDSNFSFIASKLATYQIVIAPWESAKNSAGEIYISSIYFTSSLP